LCRDFPYIHSRISVASTSGISKGKIRNVPDGRLIACVILMSVMQFWSAPDEKFPTVQITTRKTPASFRMAVELRTKIFPVDDNADSRSPFLTQKGAGHGTDR